MKTYFPIVAVFLAVVLSGILSYHELTVLRDDGVVVTHSHDIQRELIVLLSQVKDLETGQRGYLYTNNPAYLQPYNDAQSALNATYSRLYELTKNEPRQRAELSDIRVLLEKKVRETEETVGYQRAGDTAKARALVETNAGFELMEQIRSAVGKLDTEQAITLRAQQQKVRRSAIWLYVSLSGTTLLVLILLGLLSRALANVTRSRNAEKVLRDELQRSYESLDRILKSVAAGFLVLDQEGRIAYVNEAAGTLLRKPHQTLAERPIWNVFPELKGGRFQLQLRKALAAAKESVFEEFYPPLEKWLEVHTYPSPAGTSVFLIDVTQRKQSEAALRKAEQLAVTGRFAATVAHEINNPLEAVTNLIYLASREAAALPGVLKYLDLADKELERVAHMTKQTLGFYREVSAPTQFAPAEVLDELLNLFSGRFNSKDLQVERLYDSGTTITAIRGEIRQIFANILLNAIDASPHNGKLEIRLVVSGNDAVVTFSDEGPGIPERDVERVFEPFFTTKKDVGTGLGLWVARDLATKHNGNVQILRDGARQGASIEVRLPTAAVAESLSVQVGQ